MAIMIPTNAPSSAGLSVRRCYERYILTSPGLEPAFAAFLSCFDIYVSETMQRHGSGSGQSLLLVEGNPRRIVVRPMPGATIDRILFNHEQNWWKAEVVRLFRMYNDHQDVSLWVDLEQEHPDLSLRRYRCGVQYGDT